MIAVRETFSPLRIAPPTETEIKAADAELLVAEDILTALCNSEDGIALCATLMGYGKAAPTTNSLPQENYEQRAWWEYGRISRQIAALTCESGAAYRWLSELANRSELLMHSGQKHFDKFIGRHQATKVEYSICWPGCAQRFYFAMTEE